MSGRQPAMTRPAAGQRKQAGGSGRGASACVKRAMEAARHALARNPAAASGLAAMARAAGVSPRTLQRHFARVLELPPHAVVQRLRLDAARQTLRSGDPPTVLEAAIRHGFDHPGRFAVMYARAFGESPSATLRTARANAPPAPPACGTRIMLRALVPAGHADAARARRATDDLAMAIGRARDLALLSPEPGAVRDHAGSLRLEGRVESDCVVLALVRPAQGTVLRTVREPLVRRGGAGWADRATAAVRAAIAAERVEQARRTPRHRADVETLVTRARPAALTQEPAMVGMALDMLDEALHRDPAHAAAHALAGWSRALGANHCLTRAPDGERERASEHCRRALALSPDDPEVLTLAAGVMSLTRRFDEAECLVARSLALDPDQPEALRRLGFIQNFRGDGRRAAAAFRRALRAYPTGNDGSMSLIGLGVANFILGDYQRSARALARALEQQPSRAWPHRFLTAAAMHAGAHAEARRSLASLRRHFPDLTVSWCAQSDALHAEARGRVLEGLARAGLPR
jgi:AraC-like DNA-binding protein/Flp pilus assembly protein TadD